MWESTQRNREEKIHILQKKAGENHEANPKCSNN